MRTVLVLGTLLACACGDGGAPTPPAGRLHATVVRLEDDSTRDTVTFEAEATARRCAEGRGVLVDGVVGGNGVLLWLKPGDSALAGEYAYAGRGDTTTPRSAVATVRFTSSDLARGVLLDSGSLAVREGEGVLAATLRGSGPAIPGAVRVDVEADFDGVPGPRDTVPCVPEP